MRVIFEPSIHTQEVVRKVMTKKSWMDYIRTYIEYKMLPKDRDHTKKVKFHSTKYLILEGKLYLPLLINIGYVSQCPDVQVSEKIVLHQT